MIQQFVYDGADIVLEFDDPDGAGPAAGSLAKRFLNGPAVDMVPAQEDVNVTLLTDAARVLWGCAMPHLAPAIA